MSVIEYGSFSSLYFAIVNGVFLFAGQLTLVKIVRVIYVGALVIFVTFS